MRPGIFVSRTREKLGRTCDQIGRTLEPFTCYSKLINFLKNTILTEQKLQNSSVFQCLICFISTSGSVVGTT